MLDEARRAIIIENNRREVKKKWKNKIDKNNTRIECRVLCEAACGEKKTTTERWGEARLRHRRARLWSSEEVIEKAQQSPRVMGDVK